MDNCISDYNKEKYNRLPNFYHFELGLKQFLHKPILNLLWLLVVFVIWLLIYCKNMLFDILEIPKPLYEISHISVSILMIILPIIFIIFVIQSIGNLTAKRDENALMVAFSSKALRNGCPILINKKRIKNSDVIMREYYSNISLDVWNEHKNAIADALNVHFVEPIQYGGKNNDNGKRIVIYTAKGRKQAERDVLYDDEF